MTIGSPSAASGRRAAHCRSDMKRPAPVAVRRRRATSSISGHPAEPAGAAPPSVESLVALGVSGRRPSVVSAVGRRPARRWPRRWPRVPVGVGVGRCRRRFGAGAVASSSSSPPQAATTSVAASTAARSPTGRPMTLISSIPLRAAPCSDVRGVWQEELISQFVTGDGRAEAVGPSPGPTASLGSGSGLQLGAGDRGRPRRSCSRTGTRFSPSHWATVEMVLHTAT